jgi:hypothetical protein
MAFTVCSRFNAFGLDDSGHFFVGPTFEVEQPIAGAAHAQMAQKEQFSVA